MNSLDVRNLSRWFAQMVESQGAGGMQKSASALWRFRTDGGGERGLTSLDLPFFFLTPCSSVDIALGLEEGKG